ncbi:unannotated protein [freshwater metagenome]|uniref:Unannotated protein n=1 Tax=freshwater metagenome TaxID=449393 RepID=A0A6J7H1D5_9ZZZZ|nr:DUF4173 domain-containing protein [Actinomycetota bacterium]
MSKNTLLLTLAATTTAALVVAGQRIGLAVSVVLLLALAAAVSAAPRRVDRSALTVGVLLALQPTLRDAGWVVAITVAAALVAGAAAVAPPNRWPALARVLVAPLRLGGGTRAVVEAGRLHAPEAGSTGWAAAARGLGLAGILVAGFGGLFAWADPAFADAGERLLDVGGDPAALARRGLLALLVCGVTGALVRAGATARPVGPFRPWVRFGATELRIAVAALVGLFAAFVVVQGPILFGGDPHVQATAGLGYGTYAREGFVQLVVVALLTLGVVGVAARTPDSAVRALLAALCVLTVVVLLSAHLRLGLVTEAYGLTRVRLGGRAVVLLLGLVLCLVLAAGASRAVADRAPRLVLLLCLAGVLAFSLVNPDGRIAASAAARVADGRPVDRDYVRGLSADALHRLWQIPRARGGADLWDPIERRLERPDGVAGFNVGRWTAR